LLCIQVHNCQQQQQGQQQDQRQQASLLLMLMLMLMLMGLWLIMYLWQTVHCCHTRSWCFLVLLPKQCSSSSSTAQV
jgi:hypothetical protein